MRAEEVDRRHQHEPGERPTRQHHSRNARADNVSDTEILRCDIGPDRGATQEVLRSEVRLVVRRGWEEGEEVFVLEQGVQASEAQPEEDPARKRPAALARFKHVRAGRALRVGKGLVLVDDELFAQRDHKQDAEPAAKERKRKDARRLEIEAKEDERGQREDHAGGDRLTGIPGGLDDVVLENGRFAERTEDGDRQDGDGDRSGDRQPCTQPDIDRHGTEEDPEQRAKQQRSDGKLGTGLSGGHERFKGGAGRGGRRHAEFVSGVGSAGGECISANGGSSRPACWPIGTPASHKRRQPAHKRARQHIR